MFRIYAFYKGYSCAIIYKNKESYDDMNKILDDALLNYDNQIVTNNDSIKDAAKYIIDQLDQSMAHRTAYNSLALSDCQALRWIFNIYWLEHRNFLKNDDNNGMMFVEKGKK